MMYLRKKEVADEFHLLADCICDFSWYRGGDYGADYHMVCRRCSCGISAFPVLEGIAVRGIEIQMISDLPFFLRENQIEIAILTLPKNKAGDMADILIENGIRAIWNFAHIDLETPDDVIVENVHLSESLMRLSYNLSQYRQEHENS